MISLITWLKNKKKNKEQFSANEKAFLVILPILFLMIIAFNIWLAIMLKPLILIVSIPYTFIMYLSFIESCFTHNFTITHTYIEYI